MKINVLFGLVMLLLAQTRLAAQTDNLESPPYFKGCDATQTNKEALKKCSDEKMMQFLAKNLKYPPEAVENNLQGVVIIGFEIDKSGNIANTTIMRDIGMGCGKAALDVINIMPQWSPAMLGKEPVRFKMQLPVRFVLDNDQADESPFSIHWGKNNDHSITKTDLQQLLLSSPLMVRDNFGNSVAIETIKFNLEKGRKIYSETSKDSKITPKMHKLAKKAKPGNTFLVTVYIKKDGKIIPVEKVYDIK